jgi:antitoxin component HigA of HigAB toxin-antitoxin module
VENLMEPRIIKTNEQYRRYLAEAAKLAARDPEARSKEGGRLELLAKLIEDFEKERYNFRKPDPVEAIVFRMQQQGLRQKDIADLLGGKNRASEVLSRKRPLTLTMIRAVYEKLDIPAELLIREPSADYEVSLEATALRGRFARRVKRPASAHQMADAVAEATRSSRVSRTGARRAKTAKVK